MLQPHADWVSFDADKTQGLDLLGLRAPVQAIGNDLFNGVTTVTPKLRYMSVIAWIIWRYSQAKLPDAWAPFARFASAQEAVIVMANLLHDKNIRNLVGVGKAGELLNTGRRTLPLQQLVQNIAFNIYVSSSRQLNLTHETNTGFTGLTEERGLRLARAFDDIVRASSYGAQLTKRPKLERVSRESLEELSGSVSIDHIPQNERNILIDAIMPATPVDRAERNRLECYSLLLWLGRDKRVAIDEGDVFSAAREIPSKLPSTLRTVLDSWLDYIIRDLLAVTHEAVFEAVLRQVDVGSTARGAPAIAANVVAALLSTTEEHNDALRQYGLLGNEESIDGMTFERLRGRVQRMCQNHAGNSNGLNRWSGGLSETDLYEAALQSETAAMILLPVAWCLAALRVRSVKADATPVTRRVLTIGGIFQIGLADVILPKIEEFSRGSRTVLEVMAELTTRTVHQHLRVAWSRFATPQGKDVSVLVADMDTWSRNNDFRAGRTDSRLRVAISWLHQLGLANENGLTSAGDRVLDRSLHALSKGAK